MIMIAMIPLEIIMIEKNDINGTNSIKTNHSDNDN